MQLICLTRTKLGFQIPHDEEIKPLNGFLKAIFIAGPCAGVIDLSVRISNRLSTRIHKMLQHCFIDPLEMSVAQARRAAGGNFPRFVLVSVLVFRLLNEKLGKLVLDQS